MKKIVIDAAEFSNKSAMFDVLHAAFGTENFIGSNLDALHDCLTMIFEPTEITVRNYAAAIAKLGQYANVFWHVLNDAEEENPNLHIVIS